MLQWLSRLVYALQSLLERILSNLGAGIVDFESESSLRRNITILLIIIGFLVIIDYIVQMRWRRLIYLMRRVHRFFSRQRRASTAAAEQQKTLRDIQAQPERLPEFMTQRLQRGVDPQSEPEPEPDGTVVYRRNPAMSTTAPYNRVGFNPLRMITELAPVPVGLTARLTQNVPTSKSETRAVPQATAEPEAPRKFMAWLARRFFDFAAFTRKAYRGVRRRLRRYIIMLTSAETWKAVWEDISGVFRGSKYG
ncbi:MAG: hypothetical protein FWD16_00070 [Clostridia bacterium]|nr:hypothetical protein [Clostridia bacterium]